MTSRRPAKRPLGPAQRRSAKPPTAARPAGAKSPARKPSSTSKPAAPPAPPMPALLSVVQRALDDMKAVDVQMLDVRGLTTITDVMVVASGTSDRHVKAIADRIVQETKSAGRRPFGVEGERDGEWVLVDLPDVLVHVMLPRVREFYSIEQLWDMAPRIAASVPATPGTKPARRARAGR